MVKEQFEIDFLTNKDNYYLTAGKNIKYDTSCERIDLDDFSLFHIEEISFEDNAPRKEALENVLTTMKIDGVNFIYLILGDENGVHFYYGVARNYTYDKEMDLSIYDVGKEILEPSIKGNFRGSKTSVVGAERKIDILNKISDMKYFSLMEGVPGSTKEDEKFQGVDRLADVMMGDTFGFMIIASPANYNEIKDIERDLYDVYSRIVPLAKKSMQTGTTKNTGSSMGKNEGVSTSVTENKSKSKQESVSVSDSTNKNKSATEGTNTSQGTSTSSSYNSNSKTSGTTNSGGTSYSTTKGDGTSHTEGKNIGGSETEGTSKTEGTNKSVSTQESTGEGSSTSVTIEYVDKKSQDWIKYLDEVIMPRLDYGMGKGIFITSTFMFTKSKAVIKKLENTAISLYSGETGNKVPLQAVGLTSKNKELNFLKNFQLPTGSFRKKGYSHEAVSRSALSQYVKEDESFSIGNWITTNELAMIAGLPQKEVVGLALKEEVEFGLNCDNTIESKNRIPLGRLVQSGNVLENNNIYLDRKNLDKHIFIAGVTGSGKTTTCQNILCNSDIPFLVIEPAKTEYRIMKEKYDDLMVFTLGNDNGGTPFRLNPFEFFPHESITSRVDMIRASIEAAFDMEAAIPQLIESAIYACYEDYGWNIATNHNSKFENPFEDGIYAFPTLGDLIQKVDVVVEDQGFDARLKNDYIGSIKARLLGLLMGSKGLMLNTRRSIDFMDLLEKRVVLELEEIRSGAEKSLIMGFVLTNLVEAIKGRFLEKGVCSHITLVEEAHRLLSKFVAGDSPNKKQGVETFTDMLAEIRKYGESLMIVDQIPNKLTPEILKNTNTKIVHRLFAADDKDAIGNTIVLDNEQKEFLSNLETGRAIVFTQGYPKALQVQINPSTRTDSETQIPNSELKKNVYQYYSKNYKRGIITNSQYCEKEPSEEEIEMLLNISRDAYLSVAVDEYGKIYKKLPDKAMLVILRDFFEDERSWKVLGEMRKLIKAEEEVRKKEIVTYLKEYLGKLECSYLVVLLMLVHYKQKGKAMNEEKMDNVDIRKHIEEYIYMYTSDCELTSTDVRHFSDKL